MPHLVIVYTPHLEADPADAAEADFSGLCRKLADAMLSVRDEQGAQVFPTGGVRVLAYPAAHYAVADGSDDEHGFVYFKLRMGRGRSAAVVQRAGETLAAVARAHFEPLLRRRHVGLTLQIDEGGECFDAKFGNLHAQFQKKN